MAANLTFQTDFSTHYMRKWRSFKLLRNVVKSQNVQNYIFGENTQKLRITNTLIIHEQGSRVRDNGNKHGD